MYTPPVQIALAWLMGQGSDIIPDQFANGETHIRFDESIRGSDVFIMQSHANVGDLSLNDAVMEQLIMVDTARRASAKQNDFRHREAPVSPH